MLDTEKEKRSQDKKEWKKHAICEAGNGDGTRRANLQNDQEAL